MHAPLINGQATATKSKIALRFLEFNTVTRQGISNAAQRCQRHNGSKHRHIAGAEIGHCHAPRNNARTSIGVLVFVVNIALHDQRPAIKFANPIKHSKQISRALGLNKKFATEHIVTLNIHQQFRAVSKYALKGQFFMQAFFTHNPQTCLIHADFIGTDKLLCLYLNYGFIAEKRQYLKRLGCQFYLSIAAKEKSADIETIGRQCDQSLILDCFYIDLNIAIAPQWPRAHAQFAHHRPVKLHGHTKRFLLRQIEPRANFFNLTVFSIFNHRFNAASHIRWLLKSERLQGKFCRF